MHSDWFYEAPSYESPLMPFSFLNTPMSAQSYSCFNMHWHGDMEIMSISHGYGEFTVQGVRHEVCDGDIVIIGPQIPHYGVVKSIMSMECRGAKFPLNLLKDPVESRFNHRLIEPIEQGEIEFFTIIKGSAYPKLYGLINALPDLDASNKDVAMCRMKARIAEILAILLEEHLYKRVSCKQADPSASIKGVITYIRENLENQICIDQLAGVAGYSKYHFHRYFKACTGVSCVTYINSMRLSKAAELLMCTQLPVNVIAQRVGIGHTSYFIHIFGDAYGMTPKAFRSFGKSP